MNRSTKVLSASENLRVPLNRGNALLVEVVGTGTGSVDLKSAVDGVNWTNHPYVQSRAAAPSRSVSQITSMTRTQYVMLPPLTDVRIDVVVTTGTVTIMYREVEYAGLASAGGGGDVATDALFDAKGDLVVGTGADTAARLAVGANDTIPMADSGEATGIKWVAPTSAPAAVGTQAGGTGDTFTRGDHVHATGAGTPSTQAFGDAAAIGTGPAASMTDHKHAMPSFATPAVVLGSAAAAGVATTPIRSDGTIEAFDATAPADIGTAATGAIAKAARRDHVHATGAGTPSTQALGDAAAIGTGPAAAMTDHKHAMPSFATPAVVLGTAAAAGVATTPIRSDATIVAFDVTAPAAVGTAATGAAAVSARRDHVHATGAGTPSTQAFGDAAAIGTGPAASMTDHKHAMPSFATPAIVLGTAAAAGVATTPIRSDATIVAFDATVPANTGTAAAGAAAVAARRDHVHAVVQRTNTVASSATPSINVDTTDIFTITALAVAITSMTSGLSGTPVNGQKLTIRFLDNGTGRAITWGASYRAIVALPTTTVASKTLYVGFLYNTAAAKWDCVASAEQA